MANTGNSERGFLLEFKRETLVDQIVTILEERIFTGELKPASRLSEPMVAEEFGVSRIPAREALQRLEELNLVEKTHRGRIVKLFGKNEFREIYELKNGIEAYGAMLGCLRATREQIKQLQSHVEIMRAAYLEGSFNAISAANFKFHDLLVSFCANSKVIDTYINLVKQVRWATSISLKLPDRPRQTLEEHIAIFESYVSGNAQNVLFLLHEHSKNNLDRIMRRVKNGLRRY